MSADRHPALSDLHRVVDLGLQRGAHLLTRGERLIAARIAGLEGAAGLLYARLTTRVPSVHALDRLTTPGVDDIPSAVHTLEELDLVDRLVPWPARAAHLPRRELLAAARDLGLPTSVPKAELVEALGALAGWHPSRWIRVRHRSLVRRLERFAQLRARPDRATWVVARLGVIRWPDYPLTRGAPLWPTRRALRAWEALLRPELTVDQALEGLRSGAARAPGRLDLQRRLVGAVREIAREQERSDDPAAARQLYERLHTEAGVPIAALAFRWSRALQACGEPPAALELLRRARKQAQGVHLLEIGRAGRRLARARRTSWAPERPLRRAPERYLRLTEVPAEGRPRWRAGNGPELIEAASCTLLATHGRVAIHGEGRLWRTLFALLFADAYFEPVAGALPVPHLSGPLDLGTPHFRAAREATVREVLAAVRAGEAPDRIRAAHDRWNGVQLAWAHWDLADGPTLASIAQGIGAGALTAILEAFLAHGRRAARGMPDLVVLPGPAVELPDTVPRRLPGPLLLAEIKGPSDTLRDAQLIWIDRLLGADARVEIWNIDRTVRGCRVGRTGSCAV